VTPMDGTYEPGEDADVIAYEANPDFNAYLDDEEGLVEVAGTTWEASRVLHTMEPKTYAAALADYREREREDLLDSICDDYPTPIAYHFYRYRHSAENARQRLDFLRDTWEAAIKVLHAVVVADCLRAGVRLADADVNRKTLFSEKLAARLTTIDRVLRHLEAQSVTCACVGHLPVDVIERMRDLNQHRNGYSHSAAMSEQEAARIIGEIEDEVVGVLKDLEWLKLVTLARYMGAGNGALFIRVETFSGFSMTRHIETMQLSAEAMAACAAVLDSEHVVAFIDNTPLNLRPFIHFVPSVSGHQSKLAVYKQRRAPDGNRVVQYDVMDEPAHKEFPDGTFPELAEFETSCEASAATAAATMGAKNDED
jgi:hypothetical protein